MQYNQFYFENGYWFLGLFIIPIMWFLYSKYYFINPVNKKLEKFADKNLIPHLLQKNKNGEISIWKALLLGGFLWFCLMAAMADPRWGESEFVNYKNEDDLVILLDLSKSMDGNDILPSRLVRSRQEIENIVNASNGLKIGLVAFAADSHIVSPITDDTSNILRLLPLLSTDLIFVQGTRLSSALQTAKQMLLSEPGRNKDILVISDGGFQDNDWQKIAADLFAHKIKIHVLGMATEQGTVFTDEAGKKIKRGDEMVISRLDRSQLQQLSNLGGGEYFDTRYLIDNATQIIEALKSSDLSELNDGQLSKHSEERFYFFLLPILLFVGFWFRKNFTIPFIIFILINSANSVYAVDILDEFFLNDKQLAKKALEEDGNVKEALEIFKDPYKRGVAYYKAGRFKEAEQEFCKNKRPEIAESAMYNLANSLARQDKFEKAVDVYKELLANNPNHEKAKHNLGVVQAMMVVTEKEDKEDKKKRNNPNNPDDSFGGGGSCCNDDGDDEDKEDKEDEEDKEDKEDKTCGDDEEASDDESSDKGGDEENDDEQNDKGDKQGEDEQNDKGGKDEDDSSGGDDRGDFDDDKSGDEGKADGSMSDDLANQLLDLISGNDKNFLKNQFYIESYKRQTKPTNDPW